MLKIIRHFDKYLDSHNEYFEAVVIGGGALSIMGITTRVTRDIDCIDPVIPKKIKELSSKFSFEFPEYGLKPNWINNGPESILSDLNEDWRSNLVKIYNGDNITLYSLDRLTIIKTKFWALCDRSTVDLDDLLKIRPTKTEVEISAQWTIDKDGNENWPNHVELVKKDLLKRLGHE